MYVLDLLASTTSAVVLDLVVDLLVVLVVLDLLDLAVLVVLVVDLLAVLVVLDLVCGRLCSSACRWARRAKFRSSPAIPPLYYSSSSTCISYRLPPVSYGRLYTTPIAVQLHSCA